MSTTSVLDSLTPLEKKREVRRVVASSYLGSVIEYYDFMLYATAASLVFGPVFFSDLDPLMANVASLATFATGYLARPFGGALFGHFGDRIGRKKVLIISMVMMGVASFLIGLVPPHAVIGSWAALILVLLRLIQGIAVGGEWGGAALMSLEHAGSKGRGFAASFTNAGAPSGVFLGTSIMGLMAMMPEDQFMAWGWRVPFLISVLLLVIGFFIRSRITESPIFEASMKMAEEKKEREAIPLLEVLRRPRNLIVTALACSAMFGMMSMLGTFAITYAVEHGAERSTVLFSHSITGLFSVGVTLLAGRLSDHFGRRRIMFGSMVAMAILAYPILHLLGTAYVPLIFLAYVLGKACYSLAYGPMAAWVSERFGPRTRYTGASVAYQGASLIGGAFTPLILASIYAASGGNIIPVAIFLGVLSLVSAIAIFVARESKDDDIMLEPEDNQRADVARGEEAGKPQPVEARESVLVPNQGSNR